MMKIHARVILASVVLMVASTVGPGPADAQPLVYGDTIVEILGLKTWTPQAVATAVERQAPGVTVASAACAVVLRGSLGFADAAVRTYAFAGRDTVWTTIRVIEPADSSLVQYDSARRRTIAMPDSWSELNARFAEQPTLLTFFQHTDFLLGRADSVFGRTVPAEARALRTALRQHSAARDQRVAVDILLNGADPGARQLAALIASNFPDDPSTWHALVASFRAGSDHGASAAQMVFTALARSGRFKIDWQPALESLSAIIAGTNLFAYDATLNGLVDTGIEPALARRLAQFNPRLLADHAAARSRFARQAARRYLEHAGAPDLGFDRDAWISWIES